MTALDTVAGRILDADGHEWIPACLWDEAFGPETSLFAAMFAGGSEGSHPGEFARVVGPDGDQAEISPETIWELKGSGAPGAIDMARRVKVLDALSIDKQLLFPSGPGLFGMMLATTPLEVLGEFFGDLGTSGVEAVRAAGIDIGPLGRAVIDAHNRWAVDVQQIDPRLRPAATIDTTLSISEAVAQTERLLDKGIRAFMIPQNTPPGGTSPAHPDVDPLWRTFTEADVPVILHLGGEVGFLAQTAWADAPNFKPNMKDTLELALDAYHLATVHLASQNFLTTMILGGVFERHPSLRFGVIEVSAHWVGPMAENLLMWAEQFSRSLAGKLSLSPAEYLQRNVRVTPFYWEPVDEYIEQYGLDNVYTFGSDYPHHEGGKNAAETFANRLERLGPQVVEKFFIDNAKLLFP